MIVYLIICLLLIALLIIKYVVDDLEYQRQLRNQRMKRKLLTAVIFAHIENKTSHIMDWNKLIGEILD